MLNNLKSLVALGLLLGLMAGCSSNKPVEEPPAPEPEPEPPVVYEEPEPEPEPEPEVIVDTVFYFEFDSAVLSPEARAALLVHAEQLNANPEQVRLEGHADERGTREYNMALGERRANAVRDFLLLQGVAARYIETISYGEERPIDTGSYESSWARNRRVELIK